MAAARQARVTQIGRSLMLYLEDPAVSPASLGPLGNFVRVNFDTSGRRVNYEAAVRGYGSAGSVIAEALVSLADRIAEDRGVGKGPGPATETYLGRVEL